MPQARLDADYEDGQYGDGCNRADASAESVSIELQSKLYALGIFPGVEIKILRQAPLGDPLQVRVGPSLLSIRKRDAAFIDVDMVS